MAETPAKPRTQRSSTRRPDRAIRIQSLARADAIFTVLADGPRIGCRLRDIAAATGLAPSTAVTLLQSLTGLRLVERTEAGLYRLGPRFQELGRQAEGRQDLLELGRPSVIRLCQRSGETVSLLVPGTNAMIIGESLEGDIRLKETVLKGKAMPLHGTASGKCFLAYATADVREAFLQAAPLAKLTNRTIHDLARLEASLTEIRRQGYATEEEEFRSGDAAVAAPILDRHRRIRGTISITAPAERLGGRRLGRLVTLLKAEAQHISGLLA
ncbi:MAG TPA: IclR family transcriptional regulator [Dongiaceae bacterium]|nr:IclR family transcriptional regulator [Dongiaceae bacterium]